MKEFMIHSGKWTSYSKGAPFINFDNQEMFLKEVKRPILGQYSLIEEECDSWVRAHPEGKWRCLAKKIRDHFQWIPYQLWREKLKVVCKEFEANQKGNPYVIALSSSSIGKSEPWVLLQALEELEHTPDYIIPMHEHSAFFQAHPECQTCVLFDDAAYSGCSLKYSIENELVNPPVVLLPFCTKAGKSQIETTGASVITGSYMKCLGDFLTESEIKLLAGSEIVSCIQNHRIRTLTLFEFKLADAISTYPWIFLYGDLMNDIGGLERPLIRMSDLGAPYRN